MGGIWLLLDARSHEIAQQAYPDFMVFETRPDWMDDEKEAEYRALCKRIGYRWNVEEPATGWLKNYIDQEKNKPK
jgi:hypothetical protein